MDELPSKIPICTREFLSSYFCPITNELFHTPVVADDGKMYEKLALIKWLVRSNTSPLTREKISNNFKELSDVKHKIDKLEKVYPELIDYRCKPDNSYKNNKNEIISIIKNHVSLKYLLAFKKFDLDEISNLGCIELIFTKARQNYESEVVIHIFKNLKSIDKDKIYEILKSMICVSVHMFIKVWREIYKYYENDSRSGILFHKVCRLGRDVWTLDKFFNYCDVNALTYCDKDGLDWSVNLEKNTRIKNKNKIIVRKKYYEYLQKKILLNERCYSSSYYSSDSYYDSESDSDSDFCDLSYLYFKNVGSKLNKTKRSKKFSI